MRIGESNEVDLFKSNYNDYHEDPRFAVVFIILLL